MKTLFRLSLLLLLSLLISSCGDSESADKSSNARQVITLDGVTSGRPYSPAILTGNTLYVSGQVAVDPSTGGMIEGGIEEQTEQVLKNMKALIEKAGFTMSDVVKCNVLLADISFYGPMNGVYANYFTVDPPARKAFAVKDLPLGALVEIDAIAIK